MFILSQSKVFVILYLICSLAVSIYCTNAYAEDSTETHLFDVVNAVITNNLDIQINARDVDSARGAWQSEVGAFDETVSSTFGYARTETPNTKYQASELQSPTTRENVAEYSMGVSKKFRSGISVSPTIELTKTNALSKAAYYSIGADTTNMASFSLNVTIPLLKGSGADVVAANEKAAKINYDASKLYQNNFVAQQVAQAVQYYWSLYKMFITLQIYKETEDRARQLLVNTQKLIEHGNLPAANIEQVKANLASKRASRISSEQNIVQAQADLGTMMGLKDNRIWRLTPASFTGVKYDNLTELQQSKDEQLIEIALQRRNDLGSLKMLAQAQVILMAAAKKNMLPQLDLTLSGGYNGLSERDSFSDYFTAYGKNVAGPNASAQISLNFPLRNNEATGAFIQQKAAYEKAMLNVDNTIITIRANVINALNLYRNSIRRYKEAHESVGYYKKAADNEHKKLSMGAATLNSTIDMENYLTNARLAELDAENALLNSIITVRYQTGTVFSKGEGKFMYNIGNLISLPNINVE
ncbi:MAG: TolC family protein [Nitrospirae bacterium YQR-1]